MVGREFSKKDEKDIFNQLMNFLPVKEINLLLLNNMRVKSFNLKCLEEVLFGKIKIFAFSIFHRRNLNSTVNK